MIRNGKIITNDNKYMFNRGDSYSCEQDVVYDDGFKIGLEDLLIKRKTRTIPEVKHILDENGYYGRYGVYRVYKNGCLPVNEIRIRIDLVWSQVSYVWPDRGVFSLDIMRVVPYKGVMDVSSKTITAVDMMYNNPGCNISSLVRKCGYTEEDVAYVEEDLSRMSVLKDGAFRIASYADYQEIKTNLLTKYKTW